MIRGSVDVVNKKVAIGWIASRKGGGPYTVEAVINNQVIGRSVADRPRPDLAKAGFGEGNCGFEIHFDRELDPIYLPFVTVHLADSDLELPRRTATGYADYFRTLYERHPGTGRSASVFGGLWTDRADAAAQIKGRADIGAIDSHNAALLSRFVQDGVLLVERESPLTRTSGARRRREDNISSAVAAAMFDDVVLGVMRTIFDDHPLAIRADFLTASEESFTQTSTIEELPSPAECLGLVSTAEDATVEVETIRGGHRLPEFLADGTSRWGRATTTITDAIPVGGPFLTDRYQLPAGSTLILGPGALHRVIVAPESRALKAVVVPARQSLLRFRQQKPRSELSHQSGARIWI